MERKELIPKNDASKELDDLINSINFRDFREYKKIPSIYKNPKKICIYKSPSKIKGLWNKLLNKWRVNNGEGRD